MGQKLIISEEEKNRIKLLYETIPPPSESVLVTNKNPFKYPEYKIAIRPYSPKLKDGDLFFEMKNQDVYEKFQSNHNLQMIDDYVQKLLGKTFRTEYDDTFKIDELKFYDRNLSSPTITYTAKITNTLTNQTYSVYLTVLGYLMWSEVKSVMRFHFEEKHKYHGGLNFTQPPKLNESYGVYVKENALPESITGFSTPKNGYLGMEKIPDEYFEIRKIQRQKTDF